MILTISEDYAINRSKSLARSNETMRDESFAKRFNELVAEAGGPKTLNRLGPWLGVSATMAWNYRTGEKIPAIETARFIAQKLRCCVEYLLTGQGPKRPGPAHPELLERLAQLDPVDQQIVLNLINDLSRRYAPDPTDDPDRATVSFDLRRNT